MAEIFHFFSIPGRHDPFSVIKNPGTILSKPCSVKCEAMLKAKLIHMANLSILHHYSVYPRYKPVLHTCSIFSIPVQFILQGSVLKNRTDNKEHQRYAGWY